MGEILKDFEELNNIIISFKSELNNIQKKVKKLEKKVQKENKKHIKKKRKPSGFAKPQKLSKELCEFLNIEENSILPRTEVTKRLIKYIKEKDLSRSNKINLDSRLKKLINEDEVTYFTIQKEMNKHYL